ncbi:MAG: desulfoferrodoxin [Lachnospiraceae bacterium]|nr:desulfoferrodoxin [Lachnospiraceae bacterium]
MKFLRCKKCGKIIAIVNDTVVPTMCCGEAMEELIPGTTDAAQEKHVPVYEVNGNIVTVTVGSVEHPMTPEHYIQWIAIKTKNGNQRKILTPTDAPKATFAIIDGDEVEEVYEYCNLHGLWKA